MSGGNPLTLNIFRVCICGKKASGARASSQSQVRLMLPSCLSRMLPPHNPMKDQKTSVFCVFKKHIQTVRHKTSTGLIHNKFRTGDFWARKEGKGMIMHLEQRLFVFIMCDTECCKDIMAKFVMSRWGVSILFCSIMFVIFHNAKFKCIRLEWNMFLMLKFSLIAL